jgi:hypothetical protein
MPAEVASTIAVTLEMTTPNMWSTVPRSAETAPISGKRSFIACGE